MNIICFKKSLFLHNSIKRSKRFESKKTRRFAWKQNSKANLNRKSSGQKTDRNWKKLCNSFVLNELAQSDITFSAIAKSLVQSNSTVIVIQNAKKADEGKYEVLLTNKGGTAKSKAEVTVNGKQLF